MVEPTLEDDLSLIKQFALAGLVENVAPQVRQALDRVSAALRDRAHLEYGARFLAGMLNRAEANGVLVPEAATWLVAERARRQRTDGK